MKVLITGCGGFIGSHLADFLVAKGFDIYGTIYKGNNHNLKHLKNKIKIIDCDMTNKKAVEKIISEIKPDYIFHLAAQSLVIESWKDPEKTLSGNMLSTLYLFDAVRKAKIKPKILVACSSAEYGISYEDEIPIRESKEFRPTSPYGVSKVCTDTLSYLYWKTYGMNIVRIRFFNITGTRKIFDACSDFAKGIVEVKKGMKKQLEVGNLDGIRDLTDVRDAVAAAWLLAEKGVPGEVYNVCSGKGQKVGDVLNKLLALSKTKLKIVQAKDKIRPVDDPLFIGDNSKIRKLGWKPSIPIERTLEDMLDYWRKEL
jgi:GDP-4-dehydro-6-deoxy-D-mannose reductase